MIEITINGIPQEFEKPVNMTGVLDQLELTGKRVAIERNGEIVSRSRFAEEKIRHGDKLEIVVAVGGG